MAYDYEQCPEFAGAMTEPRPPAGERWPESAGPMLDGQALAQGYGARTVTIGQPPPLLPREQMWAERDECERRNLLRRQIETAAYSAARDAMLAQTLSAQVLADVDAAVEKAVAAAPAGTEAS